MNMHGNRGLMRMEKRAVNKLGLFLIILIALAFFGGGGYLLYKNRNNLDFSFPWEKEQNQEKKKEEEDKAKKKIALERQKITLEDTIDGRISSISYRILEMNYSETDGYVIKIQLFNSFNANFEYYVEYIDIDGYQIDFEDKIALNPSEAKLEEIKIPVSDLDKYGFETFKKINIHTRVEKLSASSQDENRITKKIIVIKNIPDTNNTQLPKAKNNMGKGADLRVDYYKTEETENFTDIYLLLTNESGTSTYDLVINAYKINDTIETNNDFKETVHPKCTKVVILSIPKEKYKKIDKLTMSFFVLENNDIYITKTTTLELGKK